MPLENERPIWINVKDQLPEVQTDVLACVNRNNCEYIAVLTFCRPAGGEEATFCDYSIESGDYFATSGVTHWMHLPERPQKITGDEKAAAMAAWTLEDLQEAGVTDAMVLLSDIRELAASQLELHREQRILLRDYVQVKGDLIKAVDNLSLLMKSPSRGMACLFCASYMHGCDGKKDLQTCAPRWIGSRDNGVVF